MNLNPPTHRSVPVGAGRGYSERRRGEAHVRASGRSAELSPLRVPVARVLASAGGLGC
jgi:hypothetical protein